MGLSLNVPALAAPAAKAGPRLLVFWHSDCATCRHEIERIPIIARDNPNLHIQLLTLRQNSREPAPPLPTGMPSNVEIIMGNEDTKTQLREYGNPTIALPFSVGLHPDGSYCQRYFGLLGIDRARDWATSC